MGEFGWPAWVGIPFVVAVAGTWLARGYALRRRLLDQPGERRSHVVATPRGGGVGIVLAMCCALAMLAFSMASERGLALAIAVGLLIVATVGWVDDHRPLPPWTRLLAHALAAACLGGGMLAAGLPTLFVVVGVGLALVLTNVWNFMDGIDALAASQGLLVALACAAFAARGPAAWLALALAAACAGFLPFNLPGARIFLGDVGSGALGFLLAALVVWSGSRAPDEAPLLLLPLSAFLLDASLTLAGRVWRGEPWWLPHTQHAYQSWVRRLGLHGIVTGAYALWSGCALLLMLVAAARGPAIRMLALAGCYLAGAATWTWLQRPPHPPRRRANDALEGLAHERLPPPGGSGA